MSWPRKRANGLRVHVGRPGIGAVERFGVVVDAGRLGGGAGVEHERDAGDGEQRQHDQHDQQDDAAPPRRPAVFWSEVHDSFPLAATTVFWVRQSSGFGRGPDRRSLYGLTRRQAGPDFGV